MSLQKCGISLTAEQARLHSLGGGSSPTIPLQNFGKAHQRLIRERHAQEPDPLIVVKKALAASMKNAWVREIDRKTAETIILKYEWLGNMGTHGLLLRTLFRGAFGGCSLFWQNGRNKNRRVRLWQGTRTLGKDA